MSYDLGDPQTFGPMAALAGAAIAGLARRSALLPLLRRAFGSSTRTWFSGWIIAALLVGGTALLEAIYLSGDTWQYLATFLVGYFLFIVWTVAGAVVGVASLIRPHVPVVEPIVHALLGAAIGIGVALWIWLAAFGIPMGAT
jgi:hypothetical protein